MSHKPESILAALLTVVTLALGVSHTEAHILSRNLQSKVPVTDRLRISQNTVLAPGVYNLTDADKDGVIQIDADDITLDGTGVTIVGTGDGFGISMNGHKNLTLQNLNIRGFRYGIIIRNASNVTIRNSNISGNFKDTTTPFLSIERGAFYGGGILLTNVTGSTIENNTLTNQSTGLEMINSSNNKVLNNVTSSGPEGNETGQNSCWGIRLEGSTKNLLKGNTADYVDRRRYNGSDGDSAGILLVSGSHENRVLNNSFTHSGDGFFLGNLCSRASNNNYVAGNDGSFAWANAFECTFSDGNTFEKNKASNSDYGFWLGYSHNTQVLCNQINNNTKEGIAIEHGHDNKLERNTIKRNTTGIHLWADDNSCSADSGCGTNCPSTRERISNNHITHNVYGVFAANTSVLGITSNAIEDNVENLHFASTSRRVAVSQNNLSCSNSLAVAENLAFRKTAIASHGTATAGNALDGIVFTETPEQADASAWVPGNPLPTGGYWQVDLAGSKTVSEIIVFPYFINLGDFPLKFHIDASTSGAFSGEQVRVVTEAARPIKQTIVYGFPPVNARYLRLVSDDPERNWVKMMEFAAFSTKGHFPVQCRYAAYNDMAVGFDVSAPGNWWGVSGPAEIDKLIFDHKDNPAKGFVLYTPRGLKSFPGLELSLCSPTNSN